MILNISAIIADNLYFLYHNFNVFPESISPYLVKIECFCFTEQILGPGESKIFTMLFFLDPSLDLDENLKDLKELVFTYEFSEYKS